MVHVRVGIALSVQPGGRVAVAAAQIVTEARSPRLHHDIENAPVRLPPRQAGVASEAADVLQELLRGGFSIQVPTAWMRINQRGLGRPPAIRG